MAVKPIPDGFHTVTPHLTVQGASKLVEFLMQAFEAKELFRMAHPDGTLMHAEVKIGDSIVMMGEAKGECKPMPCSLYVYVDDADAIYKRALQAGATSTMEPGDQFYGDRTAGVKDPSGNQWMIATHREDVPPEELRRRAEAMMKKQPK
jgi:PhnB protein